MSKRERKVTESETREKRRRENVGRERAREREGQRAEQEYIVYSKDKGREGVREREREGEKCRSRRCRSCLPPCRSSLSPRGGRARGSERENPMDHLPSLIRSL